MTKCPCNILLMIIGNFIILRVSFKINLLWGIFFIFKFLINYSPLCLHWRYFFSNNLMKNIFFKKVQWWNITKTWNLIYAIYQISLFYCIIRYPQASDVINFSDKQNKKIPTCIHVHIFINTVPNDANMKSSGPVTPTYLFAWNSFIK